MLLELFMIRWPRGIDFELKCQGLFYLCIHTTPLHSLLKIFSSLLHSKKKLLNKRRVRVHVAVVILLT